MEQDRRPTPFQHMTPSQRADYICQRYGATVAKAPGHCDNEPGWWWDAEKNVIFLVLDKAIH